MLYYVRRFPDAGTEAQQGEALARLVANGGSLTIHAVRVGANAGLYIDVPEALTALVELRVLPGLVGLEGCLERRKTWVQRPEWVLHALLTPTAEAQPLEIGLLDGCSSACLTLHWTRAGVAGHLYASADDLQLLDRVAERRWTARIAPGDLRGQLLSSLHRPRRTGLRPLLASASPAAHTPPSTPPHAAPADPPFLASAGATGLPIGPDEQGATVALAFCPQLLAIVAPPNEHEALSSLLLERAFALGAGFVAVIPRPTARILGRSTHAERLRLLDGDDPYGSSAIPWQALGPAALGAALTAAGLPGEQPATPYASFDTLLATRGAAHLLTDEIRTLTANPGDDLRGVVAAGGGVILAVDGGPVGTLLAALLLRLLAEPAALGRPLVLLRPAELVVPAALAAQALQIAFGSTAAHSILARIPEGWELRSPDGGWRRRLGVDLGRLAPPIHAEAYAALLSGLADAPLPTESTAADVASWWDALAEGRQVAGDAPTAPEHSDAPANYAWSALSDNLDQMLHGSPEGAQRDEAPILHNLTDEPHSLPLGRSAPLRHQPGPHTRRRGTWRPRVEVRAPLPLSLHENTIPVTRPMTEEPGANTTPRATPQPEIEASSSDTQSQHDRQDTQIDLTPVAALIRSRWQQGARLPTLIAEIAPGYSHLAPHLLRSAIRSLLEAPGAQLPAPMDIDQEHLATNAFWSDTSTTATAEQPAPAPAQGDETYLSPSEAARLLGVTNKTIQRWSDDGKIAVTRNDANHRRIPRSEVERLRTLLTHTGP